MREDFRFFNINTSLLFAFCSVERRAFCVFPVNKSEKTAGLAFRMKCLGS